MAVPTDLASAGAAAFEKLDSGSGGGNDPTNTELTSQLPNTNELAGPEFGGQPAGGQGGGEATNGQASEGERNLSDLGLEPEPARSDVGTEGGVAAPLELKVAGETIIGTVDGKDLTAAELKNGYMRHSDYTKKTTEIADYRKNAEPSVQFVSENIESLQHLFDAQALAAQGDKAGAIKKATEGFMLAAQRFGEANGIEITFSNGAQSRERDPSNGQFVAKTPSEEDAELTAIAEEFGDKSLQYKQAVELRELRAALNQGKARWKQFDDGLERARQNQQSRNEIESLHTKWAEKGVTGIDLDKAHSLIGKPIDAQMALQLAGFAQIVDWVRGKSDPSKRPNEPGSQAPGGLSAEGKSLTQYGNERIRL